MKKRLFSNPGLKIASLILAFLIWLIIVNINDPVITKTIANVPITVSNASYIESMGKSFQIADNADTVSVTLRGNRSVVEPMTASDISAVADLTQIVSLESDPIMVPVVVSAKGVTAGNITSAPASIPITLEEMVSDDFVITGSAQDSKPADGFEVGKLTAQPEKVTIIGPASIIGKIDKVIAPVDVTGISKDTQMSSSLVVYDKNGEVLSDAQMSYLKFNIDEKDITVSVTLYQVVTADLAADSYTGKPAAGYQVSTMTTTPSTISLAGSSDALKTLAEQKNTIHIDASLIDVSGKDSSFDVKIDDITSALPEGVSLANDVSATVVVSVEIMPYNSKSYTIQTAGITKNGLGAGLACVFSSDKLTVGIRGTDEDLSSLQTSQITASVDLTGMAAGTYTVPVKVTLPAGYETVGDITADITISQTEPVASATGTASNAQGG